MQTTWNFASKFTEYTSDESDRQLQDSDESDDEISESSVDNRQAITELFKSLAKVL